MQAIQKIRRNALSWNALRSLGMGKYLLYLFVFMLNLKSMIQHKNMRKIDRAMGTKVGSFKFRGSTFLFDCQFTDEVLNEPSFSFGLIREICMRDCYLKWMPQEVYESTRTVLDIGANRGVFSSLISTKATKIICVECNPGYRDVIEHNLKLNKVTDFAIETAFIGTGGETESDAQSLSMPELMERYGLTEVDLIKIDIEGSEFALFEEPEWLEKVKAITMELHPAHGDPNHIRAVLSEHGFEYATADENLCSTPIDRATFLYAWRQPGRST